MLSIGDFRFLASILNFILYKKCKAVQTNSGAKMIRNRLKEMNVKITELADYLNLSRPTMYRYIELYDAGNKKEISPIVRKLFNYIDKHPLAGKNTIIRFVLNEEAAGNISVDPNFKKVVDFMKNNQGSLKADFISEIISSKEYDLYIRYLSEAVPLARDGKGLEDEVAFLEPLKEIRSFYKLKKGKVL